MDKEEPGGDNIEESSRASTQEPVGFALQVPEQMAGAIWTDCASRVVVGAKQPVGLRSPSCWTILCPSAGVARRNAGVTSSSHARTAV